MAAGLPPQPVTASVPWRLHWQHMSQHARTNLREYPNLSSVMTDRMMRSRRDSETSRTLVVALCATMCGGLLMVVTDALDVAHTLGLVGLVLFLIGAMMAAVLVVEN